MKYIFDRESFREYLLSNDKYRFSDFSLWINKIPIPIDLFDEFFDLWEEYFKIYLDHTFASIILARINTNSKHFFPLQQLPNKKFADEYNEDLKIIINNELSENSFYTELGCVFSELLGIKNYQISSSAISLALKHNGKKYDRLYLPKFFKDNITKYSSGVLDQIGLKNHDMFGNIIVDKMGLYRGGFADAMVMLFNDLLDYKIEKCRGFLTNINNISLSFASDRSSTSQKIVVQNIVNAPLWEPYFDGELKIKLNSSHPYFMEIEKEQHSEKQNMILSIISLISDLEYNSFNKIEIRFYENLRNRISTELINISKNYSININTDTDTDEETSIDSYTYPNGDVYTGEWLDDYPHGKGKFTYANGEVYEGEWLERQRHGKGKFSGVNGEFYRGEWFKGKRHGQGKYTFSNNEVYEGGWVNGMQSGLGKYTNANGDVYEGEWLKGDQHGQGKYTDTKGNSYKGEWVNGNLKEV
jgi:hypothetical protein